MDRTFGTARLFDWGWFLVWALASSAWCVSASYRLSPTFDEPIYLLRGLESWRCDSNRGLLRMGTMPLPVHVTTLPLYAWERWTGQELDPLADLENLLPWARRGTLLFWWLLLFYGMLAGRELGGPWGGRLAVMILACEPNLLAHACLATTDIAVSAALLGLFYYARRGRGRSWGWRVGLPAICFAVAVLAKASGLVFGILGLGALELFARCDEGTGGKKLLCFRTWSSFLRDLVQVAGLGLLLVFFYCGCDWQPEPSFLRWARGLPEDAYRPALTWLAENLRIFSNAGEAIVRQIRHNLNGHGVYLLGRSDPRALWYYFPVALSIKTSLAVLGLGGLLLLRPRLFWNWALVIALFLLAFSLQCRVQIGIRMMLPLLALAGIGLAGATARGWREVQPMMRPAAWGRWCWNATAIAALCWGLVTAIRTWPDGLSYANELWGGKERAYLLLSDSNYDWGQGVYELRTWARDQGLSQLDVWYFGTDPGINQAPLRNVPLHQGTSGDNPLARVQSRFLAASTTMVYGSARWNPTHARVAGFLAAQRPVARTTTYLIYDLGPMRELAGAAATAAR